MRSTCHVKSLIFQMWHLPSTLAATSSSASLGNNDHLGSGASPTVPTTAETTIMQSSVKDEFSSSNAVTSSNYPTDYSLHSLDSFPSKFTTSSSSVSTSNNEDSTNTSKSDESYQSNTSSSTDVNTSYEYPSYYNSKYPYYNAGQQYTYSGVSAVSEPSSPYSLTPVSA